MKFGTTQYRSLIVFLLFLLKVLTNNENPTKINSYNFDMNYK